MLLKNSILTVIVKKNNNFESYKIIFDNCINKLCKIKLNKYFINNKILFKSLDIIKIIFLIKKNILFNKLNFLFFIFNKFLKYKYYKNIYLCILKKNIYRSIKFLNFVFFKKIKFIQKRVFFFKIKNFGKSKKKVSSQIFLKIIKKLLLSKKRKILKKRRGLKKKREFKKKKFYRLRKKIYKLKVLRDKYGRLYHSKKSKRYSYSKIIYSSRRYKRRGFQFSYRLYKFKNSRYFKRFKRYRRKRFFKRLSYYKSRLRKSKKSFKYWKTHQYDKTRSFLEYKMQRRLKRPYPFKKFIGKRLWKGFLKSKYFNFRKYKHYKSKTWTKVRDKYWIIKYKHNYKSHVNHLRKKKRKSIFTKLLYDKIYKIKLLPLSNRKEKTPSFSILYTTYKKKKKIQKFLYNFFFFKKKFFLLKNYKLYKKNNFKFCSYNIFDRKKRFEFISKYKKRKKKKKVFFFKKKKTYKNIIGLNKPNYLQNKYVNFIKYFRNSRINYFNNKTVSSLSKPLDKKIFIFRENLRQIQFFRFFFGCISKNKLSILLKNILKKKFLKNKNDFIFSLFLNKLESRLDIILLRSGLSKTIFESKQLIRHSQILVNNKIIKSPSFYLKKGDFFKIINKKSIKKKIFFFKTNFYLYRNLYEDRFNKLSINTNNILHEKNFWNEKKKNIKKNYYSKFFFFKKYFPIQINSKEKKRRKKKKIFHFLNRILVDSSKKFSYFFSKKKKKKKRKDIIYQIKNKNNLFSSCIKKKPILLKNINSLNINIRIKKRKIKLKKKIKNLKKNYIFYKFNLLKIRFHSLNYKNFQILKENVIEKRKIPKYISVFHRLSMGVFFEKPNLNEIEYPFKLDAQLILNYLK